eukprot:CAMPEP_0117776718 /NCGR_PEP_ID=MMETSP0947-20121206/27910_1 /TAXON_ID=44440 /ORGANISM="Chattonella subsalsa, Strain CCMP2191" /LENGTH=88 /DNA_ID=CAMNT_0005603689 /DNA_START=294 /DNA_END=560 /DNA_ORIENTATION=+
MDKIKKEIIRRGDTFNDIKQIAIFLRNYSHLHLEKDAGFIDDLVHKSLVSLRQQPERDEIFDAQRLSIMRSLEILGLLDQYSELFEQL